MEFGERTGPTPGSEFGFGERFYTGSAGSEFGERTRSNPGSSGLEKGTGRTLVRQVWRKDSAEPWFGRFGVRRMGRVEPWFRRFGVLRKIRAEP